MRIVVSGTHASGKSTLISDFAMRHPDYTVLPDPFELLDEAEAPGGAMFGAQLRLSAERLIETPREPHVIVERGPLDFFAYLLASAELGGRRLGGNLVERATPLTRAALEQVDLLLLLPLSDDAPIVVGDDEDPALRDAVDGLLQELVDDPELVGDHVRVVQLFGDPAARLSALKALAGQGDVV